MLLPSGKQWTAIYYTHVFWCNLKINFRLNYVIFKKEWYGENNLFFFLFRENNFKPFPNIFSGFSFRRSVHPPLAILWRCRLCSEMAPIHTPVKTKCRRRQCVQTARYRILLTEGLWSWGDRSLGEQISDTGGSRKAEMNPTLQQLQVVVNQNGLDSGPAAFNMKS